MTSETLIHWPKFSILASAGDKHENWQLVEDTADAMALKTLFEQLCEDQETAFAQVKDFSKFIKKSGYHRTMDRIVIKEPNRPEHAHHDKDRFGHLKHWEGTRGYDYVFEIKQHSIKQDSI
ncbi:hypothetical protein LTR96_011556 [Exophiala xenobiotica]|nr:hypothetical protein LTR72_011618 [Exophiala xenobiotica]KAK5263004.1 hypothetical protein LTR96_011556 [Exophiala xenobiotica]KAK5284693.1 hypothetical protein LTR14_011562 [Exophiala xenobiotica]KAK5332321.1 hypothetical protein LTR98_011551 [Exophiala xenobiotica]KAK5466306.1 hypothetical protein LTR55_011583 [Exophiala xenobiotica]